MWFLNKASSVHHAPSRAHNAPTARIRNAHTDAALRDATRLAGAGRPRGEAVAPSGNEDPSVLIRSARTGTQAEDRALFSIVWSGATGDAKCLPGRPKKACELRLSQIKKQMDKKDKDYWTKISRAHKHAPRLVNTLTKIMEDVDWYEEVQREREKRAAAADEQPPASEPHVAAPIIAVNCALRMLDVCTRVAHATSDQMGEAAASCSAALSLPCTAASRQVCACSASSSSFSFFLSSLPPLGHPVHHGQETRDCEQSQPACQGS